MQRKFLVIFILVVSFFSLFNWPTAFAQFEGTTAGVVLSQPGEARAVGMAEAYTAMEGEVSCLNYNLAGLARLKGRQASFLYLRGIAEDNFGSLNFATPIYGLVKEEEIKTLAGLSKWLLKVKTKKSPDRKRLGTLAASLIYYNVGDIDLINSAGENKKTVNAETDYVASLSFSVPGLAGIKDLSLGLSGKILRSKLIEEFPATAFALDFGGLYKLLGEKLSLGFAVQNLGTKLKYQDQGDSLPMTIRAGAAYQESLAKEHKIQADLDLVKPKDTARKINLGAEYIFKKLFALRAGYRIGDEIGGLTFGLGLRLKNFSLDYALATLKELNSTHRVACTVHF